MSENPIPRARALVLLAVLAVLNLGFAAALIVPSYVTLSVPGQTPDFAAFWAAAKLTLEGTPALAYDWETHRAAEVAGLGYDFGGWMPWHYPPTVQLVVTPLGALPLFWAMAVWVGLTGALFLWTCWRILPGPGAVLAGLAAAPTAMTLVNGQIGFLIAALMGLALLELDRRPGRAGVLMGLLSFKPHLALALPVALAVTGRWRAFLWAAASVAALAGVAWAAFGAETWAGFHRSIFDTTGVFTGDGAARQNWVMGAGLYGWLSYLGAGFGLAMGVQGVAALGALALTALAWRDPRIPPDLKAALTCFATLVAAPRVLNYDLHILVIGALFQVRHALKAGFFRGEQWLLAGAALVAFLSLLAPPAANPALAIALLAACWLGHVRGR